jgi:hypothetical protein
MSKKQYLDWNFRKTSLDRIKTINEIIEEYQGQGYDLSLRQLYYQLVAGGYIENSPNSYDRIGELVKNARLAGLVDWDAITDRTRVIYNEIGDYHGPLSINIKGAVENEIGSCFSSSKWAGQRYYVEVWVEKDALSDIVALSAEETTVAYYASKGYSSVDALHNAAERMKYWHEKGKDCVIIYLGDHDPTGIHIPRDMAKYMQIFGASVDIRRIALNLEQVRTYNPPPNMAKESDTRYGEYVREFSIKECWELDALKPQVIRDLIIDVVNEYFDTDIFSANVEEMEHYKREQWEKYGPILQMIEEQTG